MKDVEGSDGRKECRWDKERRTADAMPTSDERRIEGLSRHSDWPRLFHPTVL